MRYSFILMLLLASMLAREPGSGMAASDSLSPLDSNEYCEEGITADDKVVVGPYPLRVIVANIDYQNRTIDFKTEVGTFLHVYSANDHELQALEVGDVIALCIAEELHGDIQT